MKRKLFPLLFAIIASTTVFSETCGELFKIQATGTLTGIFEGEAMVNLPYETSEYEGFTGYKLNSTGRYIGVELAEGYTLQEGDIVTIFVTKVSPKLQLFSDMGNTLIAETNNVNLGENEIILDERANNARALYLYRTSTADYLVNPYVAYMSVHRYCNTTETVTGTCENNLSWTIDTKDSTLVLEGNGEMVDFGAVTNVPWYGYIPYIAHVVIKEGVTRIGTKAFSQCSNLVSVEFANSVTTIRVDAFSYCPKLQNIFIPSNVTYISKFAFRGCKRLKTIILEDADNRFIGEGIFANCPSLLRVISYCEYPPSIDATVFEDCGDLSLVDCFVPDESVVLYKKNDIWKAFNIKAMSEKPGDSGTQAGMYSVAYIDAEKKPLSNETVTLHVPVAPKIEGFTFLKWEVTGDLNDGITIQAVYEANDPQAAPSVYTNPSNPTQKLLRNGNVYILTDDSRTYTLDGRLVR